MLVTHRAVMTIPRSSSRSYYIEFKKAQLRSWSGAKYTRRYAYSWKRFWLSTCSMRSWWITKWFKNFGNTNGNSGNRRNGEKWERRTIAINTYILLPNRKQDKSLDGESVPYLWLTMPWVLGLVLKVWQFQVISSRRCICKNSLTKQHFRAESWISEQKFAQRFVTKAKGQNSYAKRKTGECFQRKTIGSCSRRDNCSFCTHACQVNRETVVKEVGDARTSRLEQASSSVPKVKTQTDMKNSNSLKASLATRFFKSLVYGRQDEKDGHVIIGIIPCVVVTNLETDAFVAFDAYIDMLMVRSNLSARSRKEGTEGAVSFLSEKKVQGCVFQNSDAMNPILRKAGELVRNSN